MRDDDGWVLNGNKLWITNGGMADFFTVFAKTPSEGGRGKMTGFIVTKDMEGVSIGPNAVVGEDCRIGDGCVIGPGTVIEFSVDGGKSWGAPDALQVSDASGTRPAEAGDFTHVRWVIKNELAAGAHGVVRFTAVLD